MEYRAGQLIISSEDVAQLLSAVWRSLCRWITATRRSLSPPPGRYGFYSRVYAERATQELQVARDLLAQDQIRAAGAIAGVALELHLKHVAAAHQINIRKRASIAQLQDSLRYAGLLDNQQRRRIQKFSDIRNQCVHGRKHAPSRARVERLIRGIDDLQQMVR